jgi:hypothetical protein
MTFRTIIQLNGKTATGIQVPEEVVESLGSGKKPAVKVTIKDYTYRSTVFRQTVISKERIRDDDK